MSGFSTAIPQDGLAQPQRAWAVAAVALGLVMAVLDGAIANVALPTIAADVHVSPHDSVSIINAYQIAVIVLLLPLASLGEIYGYKRIFQIGVVVFTCASLACALSSTLGQLTLARVIQGCGAAGEMSVTGALIRFAYPRARLGRGLALNALVVAGSTAAAPSIASAILAVAHWEWLFAINVPIGVACFAVAWRALPLSPRSSMRFDVTSALLSAVTFGVGMVGIMGLSHGGRLWLSIGEIALAILAGVLLVGRQLSRAEPLLPIDLLRIPLFRLSIMTSIFSFCAQMLAFTSIPFFVQDSLGRSEVTTGLLMTPWPLFVMIAAPIAGRLSDRFPAGLLGGVGLGVYALGLGLTALLPAHPANLDIVWASGPLRRGVRAVPVGPTTGRSWVPRPATAAAARTACWGSRGSPARPSGRRSRLSSSRLFPDHGQMPVAIGIACGLAVIGMVLSLLRLRLGTPAVATAKG